MPQLGHGSPSLASAISISPVFTCKAAQCRFAQALERARELAHTTSDDHHRGDSRDLIPRRVCDPGLSESDQGGLERDAQETYGLGIKSMFVQVGPNGHRSGVRRKLPIVKETIDALGAFPRVVLVLMGDKCRTLLTDAMAFPAPGAKLGCKRSSALLLFGAKRG